MSSILSYYNFIGEDINDNSIDFCTSEAITKEAAQSMAREVLEEAGGGHIDVWSVKIDEQIFEFAFDAEV